MPHSPPRQMVCARPSCRRTARHRHHIVARSVLKGEYDWILVRQDWNIFLVCNVADLCPECHDLLESQWGGCKSRLRFLDDAGFGWYDRVSADDFDHQRAAIWWSDHKTGLWKFRGFLRGEYWVERLAAA